MASKQLKQWEKVPYDAKLHYCRPNRLDRFVVCITKAKAIEYAKLHSIPQTYIATIGSRFWKGWGFMDQWGRYLLSGSTLPDGWENTK